MNVRLLAGLVGSVLICSCQTSGQPTGNPSPPCEPSGHLALTTVLSRLTPSTAFVVPRRTEPWISTSYKPDPEQLFGGLGGVVDISVAPAGAAPRTTTDDRGRTRTEDPTIDLRKTGAWYRLPVPSGSWRVYTVDLGANAVPVTVIACADR